MTSGETGSVGSRLIVIRGNSGSGDHAGLTRCYCYELDLDETLARHRTKALAAEVSEADAASW